MNKGVLLIQWAHFSIAKPSRNQDTAAFNRHKINHPQALLTILYLPAVVEMTAESDNEVQSSDYAQCAE